MSHRNIPAGYDTTSNSDDDTLLLSDDAANMNVAVEILDYAPNQVATVALPFSFPRIQESMHLLVNCYWVQIDI